ncbi:hypothetical protein SISSUDRAFT_995144, partial [Sistotremastrum suecicum HHB10207 ss-3]
MSLVVHGCRRFIVEVVLILNRVMHYIKCAGGTFSAKKLILCQPTCHIFNSLCTYEGRLADPLVLDKIVKWPPCENLHQIRAFLGTCG